MSHRIKVIGLQRAEDGPMIEGQEKEVPDGSVQLITHCTTKGPLELSFSISKTRGKTHLLAMNLTGG